MQDRGLRKYYSADMELLQVRRRSCFYNEETLGWPTWPMNVHVHW